MKKKKKERYEGQMLDDRTVDVLGRAVLVVMLLCGALGLGVGVYAIIKVLFLT